MVKSPYQVIFQRRQLLAKLPVTISIVAVAVVAAVVVVVIAVYVVVLFGALLTFVAAPLLVQYSAKFIAEIR